VIVHLRLQAADRLWDKTTPDPAREPRAASIAPCGWHGAVAEFLTLDQATFLASLEARHLRVMGASPSGEQIAAWRGEYEILGATLREIVASAPRAREWAVIFEYGLPRERGRRPDVVILTGSQVLVLEFKETGGTHAWARSRGWPGGMGLSLDQLVGKLSGAP